MIIQFYKKIGETPLEAVKRFKIENIEHSSKKISYAGRLDPMAHGILILLIGDSCKLQNSIHQISKVYRFKLLIGVSTDTYDILGLITSVSKNNDIKIEQINTILNNFKKNYSQKYPPYSSFRINGKPLWKWTKEGNYHLISDLVVSKNRKIIEYDIKEVQYLKGVDIYRKVKENIFSLSENEIKNFRVDKIIDSWKENFISNTNTYPVFEIVADVSTGTFIRSICKDIGDILGVSSCAFEIERIKVNIN